MQLPETTTILTVGAAVVAVAGWIRVKFKGYVQRRIISAQKLLIEEQNQIRIEWLYRINKEMSPNGGTSMIDRVKNLEVLQKDQMIHLKDITTDLADHRDMLKRIEVYLSEHEKCINFEKKS